MKISGNIIRLFFFLVCAVLATGCQKNDVMFSEPYQSGKEALPIKFEATQIPTPAFGLPGSTVTIKATGLLAYKDKLIFRFNGEDAKIAEINDQEVKVIVPDHASTGVLSISIGEIVFFGPQYTVIGKINLDPTFLVQKGANGTVSQVLVTKDDKRILIGEFTNYDNKGILGPINRIVRTFPDGVYDPSFRIGKGANGFLQAIAQAGDKYFVGGKFGGFDGRNGKISNLTRLNSNGTLDTIPFKTFRRPDQRDTIMYFPAFNGGFNAAVNHVYEQGGKLLVVGGFRYYIKRIYDQPNRMESRDSIILDSTEVRQFARLDAAGNLDKSYRFSLEANTGWPGANGPVNAYMHDAGIHAGKMVVYGSFTKFDDKDKRNLLRLNPDGTIDQTFNSGGAGPDFSVGSVTYNPVTKKYMIVGTFKNYNGTPRINMALLNEDGSLDASFSPKAFIGGNPIFSKQLNDGLIIVSGYFRTYNGVARNGFMVLDATGELALGYNSTGLFNGSIYDITETRSEDDKRALLIYGNFSRFDSQPQNNLIRVVIE